MRIILFFAACLLAAPAAMAEKNAWPDLSLRSADGANTIELHGQLQTDMGTGAGEGDLTFRRARLSLAGRIARDFYYKAENDWTVNNVSHGITDLYLGYDINEYLYVQGGQFKAPFNLENLGSNRFTTFNERASVNAFAPARHTGVMVGAYGISGEDRGNVMLAYTDGGIGVSRDLANTKDVTARVSYAHLEGAARLLHAGVAASYRTPDNINDSISYSAQPESRFGGDAGVATGSIAETDHAMQWGLEGAGVWGPASLQGEIMRVDVSRNGGLPDSTFGGYYLEGSYYLTGEHRAYMSRRGVFDRATPIQTVEDGGIGAWQVAARYSAIDLTSGAIEGGEMRNVTLALNWQPQEQVIVMGNMVFVNTDANASAPNDDPTLFMLRMQVDF